jgi:Predicted glycosyltransferases
MPRLVGSVINFMDKMRKIAIGIVTYNPNITLISRLELATTSGFFLYIFDNSPENIIAREFCNRQKNTKYITCGKNVGLGFGISSVCAQAYYDSYPALLFFDQDTVFDSDTLRFICNFYNENSGLEKAYSAIVFNSKDAGKPEPVGRAVKDVRLAINSGSLYFLKNLKKMNWHDMNYFVDCVDYEFCLSSNDFGFKIGEYTRTPGFDHTSEQGDQRYKLFGAEHPMRAYSLSRIWDSISATLKLLVKSVATWNWVFFYEIGKATTKYLIVQVYVRIVSALKFFKIAHGK